MHTTEFLEKIIIILEKNKVDQRIISPLIELQEAAFPISIPDFLTLLLDVKNIPVGGRSLLFLLADLPNGLEIVNDLLTDDELLSYPDYIPTIFSQLFKAPDIYTLMIFRNLLKIMSIYSTRFVSALLAQILTGPETNTSGIFWLAKMGSPGIKILRSLLSNMPNSLFLLRKDFLPTLLANIPSGPDAGTSALYWLMKNTMGIEILQRYLVKAKKTFKASLLSHPDFMRILLTPPPKHSDAQQMYSGLCLLMQNSLGCNLVKSLLDDRSLKARLLCQPDLLSILLEKIPRVTGTSTSLLYFISSESQYFEILQELVTCATFEALTPERQHELLSTLLVRNTGNLYNNHCSALGNLIRYPAGIKKLSHLMTSTLFKNGLLSHPDFLASLLARPDSNSYIYTALYSLIDPKGDYEILQSLLADEAFKANLLSQPEFLSTLLARPAQGDSALLSMMANEKGIQILNSLMTIESFKTNLFSHPSFLNTVTNIRSDGAVILNAPTIDFLVLYPEGNEIVRRILSNVDVLRGWIGNAYFLTIIMSRPQLVAIFWEALLIEHDMNASTSTLSLLLETPKGNQMVKRLMEAPTTKMAVITYLGLPEHEHHLDWLFTSEAGRSLFAILLRHHRQQLLQTNSLSPQHLFNQPQIKQLIRMGQIDPNLFLFLAATGACEKEFIDGLANPAFSLWATTAKGYSLFDVISTSLLDEETKSRRKQYLLNAIQRYSDQVSDTNFVVHLNNLGTIHTQPPDDATPPSLPDAIAVTYTIDGLNDADIQSFNQHIQWILNQHPLHAYHAAFQALALNEIIRNKDDYPVVLGELKKLCAWMNHYVIHHLPIPEPFPEWANSFKACDDGVLDTFVEMFNEFSNQPALATYLQRVQSDINARYNRLFATPRNLEVHIRCAPWKAESRGA